MLQEITQNHKVKVCQTTTVFRFLANQVCWRLNQTFASG